MPDLRTALESGKFRENRLLGGAVAAVVAVVGASGIGLVGGGCVLGDRAVGLVSAVDTGLDYRVATVEVDHHRVACDADEDRTARRRRGRDEEQGDGEPPARRTTTETVVLDLQTGKYHGLNSVGGRMLDVVNGAPTVRQAAEVIAEEVGQDPGAIEADLVAFCRDLLDRGLLEAADT